MVKIRSRDIAQPVVIEIVEPEQHVPEPAELDLSEVMDALAKVTAELARLRAMIVKPEPHKDYDFTVQRDINGRIASIKATGI